MLYAGFPAQSIRTNALLSLPISTRRTHELRRRLAVSFFFGDASLGAQNPDAVVTVRRVIDRLVGGAEFAVGPDTDYNELRAAVLLLNIAVDDGSFVAPKTSGGSSEEEKQFNADVDELATRLRDIWRRINDAGIKLARTEAKSVIEWVQQRLAHSVRTRRKPRKSVFDVARPAGDAGLPQQRNYMRNFLSKQVGKPTGKPVDQGSAA